MKKLVGTIVNNNIYIYNICLCKARSKCQNQTIEGALKLYEDSLVLL